MVIIEKKISNMKTNNHLINWNKNTGLFDVKYLAKSETGIEKLLMFNFYNV